jgi:ATP-dependent DNA ligase
MTIHVVKVFDLLHLNGLSLLQKSTKLRKRNMRHCIHEISGRIEFAVEYEGKTAKDIRDRMDEVMANRGEGLVIKHPDAQYVLNGRNKDWIKVSGLMTTGELHQRIDKSRAMAGQARVYGECPLLGKVML